MLETGYEVIIIGGGPAGLFAGIVCARNGLRTLLLEKRYYPVEKVCGEGIMPTGIEHLAKLGALPYVQKRAYRPFEGIRYVSARGTIAQAEFANGQGWGIHRSVLSESLFEQAKSLDHLYMIQGENAGCRLGDKWEVNLDGRSFRPKLLIGADGLHSKIRKKAGLNAEPSSLKRWGIRQHFQIEPWSQYVEIYWGSGLEAYVTPVSTSSINVNILWDSKRYFPKKKGQELFGSLLEEFPLLQARLMKAKKLNQPKAAGPLHQETSGVTCQNMMLLGDASGFYDPITGEGLSLAAKQALFLEEYVVPVLKQDSVPLEKALEQYSAECSKIIRPYKMMTSMVLLLRLWPFLTEQVIRVLHHTPGLFQKLLTANMR